MNFYYSPPAQPERDFIAALKARGFHKPTVEDSLRKYNANFGAPRSTLAKGDVWIGYIDTKAFFFDEGTIWQTFEEVLAEVDRREHSAFWKEKDVTLPLGAG